MFEDGVEFFKIAILKSIFMTACKIFQTILVSKPKNGQPFCRLTFLYAQKINILLVGCFGNNFICMSSKNSIFVEAILRIIFVVDVLRKYVRSRKFWRHSVI